MKKQFLNELEGLLQGIPEADRQDILRDYEEHFQIGLENGKSEEEITADLGSPRTIAKEVSAEYHITTAKENQTAGNMFRAVIAILSLGFFNLVFVLGPFIGLIGVMIALYSIPITLVTTPFLIVAGLGLPASFAELMQIIFLFMTLFGLGTLFTIGLIYLTKGVYKLVLKYLQFNLSIIRGKES